MKKYLMASALILGLALGGTVTAGSHGDGKHHHERHLERMAERLELSADQREQIGATMQAHGPELRELHRQIREQRQALREQTGDFNESAARASANTLGELTAEAAFLSTRMRADIQAVLSEEQREALAERRSQGKQRWHRHGDRGEKRGMRNQRGERS